MGLGLPFINHDQLMCVNLALKFYALSAIRLIASFRQVMQCMLNNISYMKHIIKFCKYCDLDILLLQPKTSLSRETLVIHGIFKLEIIV